MRMSISSTRSSFGRSPTGALLISGVHSHPILLQHLLIHLPKAKKPIYVSDVPKYWLDDDTMCLDEAHRWRSADTIAWLRTHGLHCAPNSIKAEIADLVYNEPEAELLTHHLASDQ